MDTQQDLDFKKYLAIIFERRRLFAAVLIVVTSLVVAAGYVLPKSYEAKSTVLIERSRMSEFIKNVAVATPIEERIKAVEVVMKSRPLILLVINDLKLAPANATESQVEALVQRLQRLTVVNLDAARSRSEVDLFTVSFKSGDPALARDYVNAIVKRYIEEILSANRNDSSGANRFLLGQIELFRTKITAIEADIARLSRERQYVAQERMSGLQKKLDNLRLQYTDSHPDVQKALAEMEAMRKQTAGGEHAERQGAQQKISALERERNTYQKIYEDLVAAMGRSEVTTHIESQDKGAAFKILEPALLPQKPVSPDRVKMILIALVAGVAAGAGLVILLDRMDRSVRSLETARSFGLPVLAVIPHVPLAAEIAKVRRIDLALYATTGLYLLGVVGLLSFELFGRRMP
ncbi:MAG: hypothetical protein M0042_15985 [Nitrospiraceae bacterium]|nr:hypothetical protein [Nitrospiraceae bacterium]